MATIKCPYCRGQFMLPKNNAQRAGTVLGGTLGYMAQAGALMLGPAGLLTTILAGALTGQKLGELVDNHVIRSYRCPNCGREIRV